MYAQGQHLRPPSTPFDFSDDFSVVDDVVFLRNVLGTDFVLSGNQYQLDLLFGDGIDRVGNTVQLGGEVENNLLFAMNNRTNTALALAEVAMWMGLAYLAASLGPSQGVSLMLLGEYNLRGISILIMVFGLSGFPDRTVRRLSFGTLGLVLFLILLKPLL